MKVESFDYEQHSVDNEKRISTSDYMTEDSIRAMQGFQEDEDIPVVQDFGLTDFKVADLPTPDDIHGPEDFNHHISWDDAQSACQHFPKIQQQVAEGKTKDDFWRDDQSKGLAYNDVNGSERVYELFYSKNDPIAISKNADGGYGIDSGRHRIFMAKHEGLDTVPVRVNEND